MLNSVSGFISGNNVYTICVWGNLSLDINILEYKFELILEYIDLIKCCFTNNN